MSGRGPYLIFAACLGAAIALLVYRFGVLPLHWNSPLAKGLELGPIALVAAAAPLMRLARMKQRPLPSMAAMLLASFGAVMLIAYIAVPGPARSKLVVRSLPGMAVSLPPGKEEKALLEYDRGELMLSNVAFAGGVISMRWSAGPVPDEDMEMVATGVQESVGGTGRRMEKWTGAGGAPIPTIVVATPRGPFVTSILACGGRRVLLAGMGMDDDSLFRRVLGSFVCQPDPVKESMLASLPWTITFPEDWQAGNEEGTAFFSNGQSMVMLERVVEHVSPDILRKVVTLLFTDQGAQVVMGEFAGDHYPLEVTEKEGTKMTGWVRQITCPQGFVMLLGFAKTKEDLATVDQMVKEKGRCLEKGEAAARWPAP